MAKAATLRLKVSHLAACMAFGTRSVQIASRQQTLDARRSFNTISAKGMCRARYHATSRDPSHGYRFSMP